MVQVIQLSSTSTPYSDSSDSSFNSYTSEENNHANPIVIDVGDGTQALERAKNWPCNKKRSFIITMKRSFVENDCRLVSFFIQ